MGGLAILHPQDVLKDNNNNLFSTPMTSRNPNNIPRSENRKPRNKSDPPPKNNLVMGQVKILKRGEPLDESLNLLNDRKVSNMTATSPSVDRKVVVRDLPARRKVTPPKKKAEKERNFIPNPNSNSNFKNIINSKIEELKIDDFALSSTDRLGPDPEMVPKKKNMAEFFFAGSAFVDSPPPSSVPLPGFFTKSFVKDDASSDLRRLLGLNLA